MLRTSLTLILVVFCFSVTGCNSPWRESVQQNDHDAKVIAKRILDLVAAGKTDEIYDGYASPEFKGTTDRQKLEKLVRFLQKKLGEPRSLKMREVNSSAEGKTAYIYQVTWEKGGGTFQLITTTSDGKTMMDGFHIKADALIDIPASGPTTKP
jgi:hypothetical protein